MSETNITRRPLWKQLTGALAGAAIAFVLYQGYSVAADRLVAAVPMGPAAGAVAGSPTSASAEATGGRPGPFVDAVGRLWPGEPWYTFASSASSSSSSDSSSQSPENRVFYGPFGSIRSLKKYFQPFPSSSSSSTTESAMTAAGAGPLVGMQGAGLSSSSLSYVTVTARSSSTSSRRSAPQVSSAASSSSWSEAFPVAAPPVAAPPIPAGTETSTDALPEPFVRLTPPAIVVGAKDVTRSALPKTGLGLDVLAVMALGAVAGGRWKRKR